MRKSITIILGLILIVVGFFISKSLSETKKPVRRSPEKLAPTAFTAIVKNGNVPIVVTESGRLNAKNRIELFSEVQGVMESTNKEFKPGSRYKKGETLVHIRSADFEASLRAQKSTLQNMITSMMPDMRLDFPEAYSKWDKYVRDFDMNKPTRKLPQVTSVKEKFFVTGKDIYTTYYKTKNMEIVLSKYRLHAPFDGILTDALVTTGSLIRQGQKLGEFIDPTSYEMEVSISKSLLSTMAIGKKVRVSDPDNADHSWEGTITRINGKVDINTQTIQIFIELKGKLLKEGMFLEAQIDARREPNALELPRNLLV